MLTQESRQLVAEIGKRGKVDTAPWHVLIAAFLGEAFDAMDASLYFIALYPAVSELTRSRSDIEIGQIGSFVLAIFMLGWFLGALIFGMVADRIGRKKTMMLTILIYSIATGLCALTQNWIQFAACRFLVGAGIGGEIILGTVVISEFWKKHRMWAICALESSFNVGLMMSAGLNAALGNCGWRWLFLAGIIPAIATLYIRSKLKESKSFEVAMTERKTFQLKAASTEAKHSIHDLPLMELIRSNANKRLVPITLLGMSAVIGYWACVAWIPAWINQLTGTLAVGERSMATTVFSVAGLMGCFATPLLISRMGRRNMFKLAFGGGLLATLGMFLCVKSYGPELMIWSFVAGFLINVQFAGLQIYVPEAFPTNVLATAAGVVFGAGRIFAALLAIGGAQLIAFYGGSYAYASATLSLVYGIGFVAAFWLYETNGEVAGVERTENRTREACLVAAES